MTVSPQRPQDGSRRPQRNVESDPLSDTFTLPPTLFTLPNLRPAAAQAANIGRNSSDSLNPVVPEIVPTAMPTAPQSLSVHSPTEPVTMETVEPCQAVPGGAGWESSSSNQHLGRTWMESIASHRKVLILLLGVIAAAVWSSRQGQDASDSQSSLAAAGELLEIDNGELDPGAFRTSGFAPGIQPSSSLAVEPASPKTPPPLDSMFDPGFNLAAKTNQPQATRPASRNASEHAAMGMAMPLSSDTAALPSAALSAQAGSPSAKPIASHPTPPTSAPATERMPDRVASSTTASVPAASTVPVSASGPGPADSAGRVESNQFVSGPKNAAYSPASSRTATDQTYPLPSLEELASQANPTSDVDEILSYRNSATPAAVTNWLQFLPADPTSVSVSE